MIGNIMQQYPEKTAIISDAEHITYGELTAQITTLQKQLSNQLSDLKGKRVALLLENGTDFLKMFFAVSASGGIAIPFDPKWSGRQFSMVIQDCKPDLIVVHKSLQSKLPESSLVITIEELNQLKAEDTKPQSGNEQDIFYIGYTSGTTGTPKGFMRTHQSWFACFADCQHVFGLQPKDHILSPGPLVHSHFLFAAVQALHMGATLHVCKSFTPQAVLQKMKEHPITVLYIVPTMFESLLQSSDEDVQSLRKIISSGAKWKKESKERAPKLFPNAQMIEFFGASELSFVTYLMPYEHAHKGETVGRVFPNVELQVKKQDGSLAKPNEIGELYVKSLWVFSGYLNRPEETAQVFQDGWVTIGDLASIDEEGYLTIIGRKHNMIISGGLNIYPEEVEQIFSELPQIEEIAVLGVEDKYWGEKVVAVLSANQPIQKESLDQHGKRFLPSYKCPKEYYVVDQLPHTSSGKVARKKVKEMLGTLTPIQS
ncbi:AMP-binding protein [Pontibacillus marinus]|uniref:Acyl-CoA synthetase n=1 Tax=Pontibacillus marinus BH030004 = DSM 16465 TaxID=1385511 RepID=A0A0A5GBP6_9BACI|nr:AMP-binding protein [Pontibacillus marinus]KGX89454.1 acyl-CoA synthetase [Pontibacillus marinus BH030004 = DSM 16465]